MLTLYYSPRACSMASHVALEEAGATFEAKEVDIFAGEQHEPAYRAVNPRGDVPALRFGDGRVLLENVAILTWIGINHVDAGLLGADPLDSARTIAACSWLSGSVHPAFKQYVHPERFSCDAAAHAPLKAGARDRFWSFLVEIDRRLASGPWMMGDRFTLADPYALVFYPWGLELALPIEDLARYAAMKDRLIARPAARRALERERSVLLTM